MNFLLREEPKIVRSCCNIANFGKISDQISNILSHVILHDFPEQWPDIFQLLLDGLSGNTSPANVLRITDTLYCAIRQITSATGTAVGALTLTTQESVSYDDNSFQYFAAKKESFSRVAPTIFGVTSSHWIKSSQQMIMSLSALLQVVLISSYAHYTKGSTSDETLPVISGKQCTLSLKVIGLLFKHYFDRFGEADFNVCSNYFEEILRSLTTSIECSTYSSLTCLVFIRVSFAQLTYTERALDNFPKGTNATSLSENLESCILNYLKIINDSQACHPLTFVPVLDPFMRKYSTSMFVKVAD